MIRAVAAALLLTLLPLPQSLALDARQVFQAVAPSTVVIESLDSAGSGVLLSDRGLILTNFHVVATNIDLKVRAKVRFGNKIVPTEIDDVKIVKVHPTYDLAIIEAKPPPNASFIPAHFLPRTAPLPPGSRCFAIGNPGGPEGKLLELSITEGIVSSTSRMVEGREYLQFSAAINHGNSGGPVCDDTGQVIGIATWKTNETEGIGFAIPAQKLTFPDFIDPKARKPDLALSAEANDAANRYGALALQTGGADHRTLVMAALECYRIAMLADPNSVIPYYNIWLTLRKEGEDDLAGKYAGAAYKLDPNNASVCHIYGVSKMKQNPADAHNVEQCMQLWFHGLDDTKDGHGGRHCADDLAVAYWEQKSYAACGYMLRWSETLPRHGEALRTQLWAELENVLSKPQLDALRAKQGGFSKAELASFVAGKPLPPGPAQPAIATTPATPRALPTPFIHGAHVPAPAPAPAYSGPTVPLPTLTPKQMDAIASAAAAKFGGAVVPAPATGLECPLPDRPENAVLANGGWQLVISFPDLLKLGIFNLATGKITGFIDCPDRQALFAAGGQLLALYLPGSQTFQLYNLDTLELVATKTNPLPGPISFIGMGLLNPSRIFVLYRQQTSGRNLAASAPAVLRVPDLAVAALHPEPTTGLDPLRPAVSASDQSEGALEETGTVAAIAKVGTGSSALAVYRIKEDGGLNISYQPPPAEHPAVTQGGQFITSRRRVRDAATGDDAFKGAVPSHLFYQVSPAAGFPALVALVSQGPAPVLAFRVYGLPGRDLLTTLPIEGAPTGKFTHAQSRDQTEILRASSYCDRIAYLLPQDKQLILFPLGLKGGASGLPQRGKHFERKVDVPPGATALIQSGPPGMKFEPATQSLVWEVPADLKGGQVIQVILLVKGADAKEEYKVEKISVH